MVQFGKQLKPSDDERINEIFNKKLKSTDQIFNEELQGLATWSKPTGGYFISLYVPNKAKEIVAKCKEMGVTLTKAGSAYPYGKDPNNSHIRIAPTFLELDELETATIVICLAIKLLNK